MCFQPGTVLGERGIPSIPILPVLLRGRMEVLPPAFPALLTCKSEMIAPAPQKWYD